MSRFGCLQYDHAAISPNADKSAPTFGLYIPRMCIFVLGKEAFLCELHLHLILCCDRGKASLETYFLSCVKYSQQLHVWPWTLACPHNLAT